MQIDSYFCLLVTRSDRERRTSDYFCHPIAGEGTETLEKRYHWSTLPAGTALAISARGFSLFLVVEDLK